MKFYSEESYRASQEPETIVTEEEFNERYNDGYNDCLNNVFKELCIRADDDLIIAMKNAVGYVADRERKEVN